MPEVEVEKRFDRLEIALEHLASQVDETSRSVNQLSVEMRIFKEEMQTSNDEMRIEMRTFKNEMNRRWGELANRLGTLVEDIVAPAFPDVIKRRFNLEIEDMMVRRKRRKKELRGEFDLIAVVGENVFVVDVKSQYKSDYVDRFSQKLDRFKGLFPEYKEKRIVGVIASLYLDESVIRYATKKGYYAMGMKGDYMDLLNVEEIKQEGKRARGQ